MYPNHRSTWLSQLEYVGVLCMWNLGCLVSILVRNFRNSVARCRRWVEVVTLPFEVSNAANNVVVPDGEMDPVLGCGALSGASSGSSANLGLATGGTPIVEVSGLIGPYASGTGRGRRIRPCRRTANRTSAARFLAVAALIRVVPQGIGLPDAKRKALPRSRPCRGNRGRCGAAQQTECGAGAPGLVMGEFDGRRSSLASR